MGEHEVAVTIVNRHGLHARPAMQLVDTAKKFGSDIAVSNGDIRMDAKSIMSVMQLAATKGTVLKLNAQGEDAEDALTALVELIHSGFGEE
ncbi:MAG: HPr family phosphocarrier protein [Planctomycetes bacterium]|nr:HPr family phosphocarrier protein [Planctomycetota bacterium]